MPKINELQEGISVEDFYALKDISLRDTRKGDQYLKLTLSDSTGSVSSNLWRVTEGEDKTVQDLYPVLIHTEVVKIRARVETYNSATQLNIERIRPATPSEINDVLSTLVAETPLDKDELLNELLTLVNSVKDDDYRAILKAFFDKKEFVESFVKAGAARSFHHAYLGGLLEHTVSIATMAAQYAKNNPAVRCDLLVTGAIFHDIGKLKEMSIGTSIEYTDEGSLIGHLNLGVMMVDEAIKRELPNFPENKKLLIYHLILSHHGQYEYGSPVLPAIPEAFALHHLDNLDAKVFAAVKAINNDINEVSTWTDRSFMLNTKIYKG